MKSYSKKLILSVIFLFCSFLLFYKALFVYGLSFPTEGKVESLIPPIVVNIATSPEKITPGKLMTISVVAEDEKGIEKVTAQVFHEHGSDSIDLPLNVGDIYFGKWEGKWSAHNIEPIEYDIIITIFNKVGLTSSKTVKYFDPGWLSGYSYRKQINISNTTTTQTNYQMKLTVNKASGTDSGSNVYLNDHSQDDFDDIRFTKSDGINLLDYWVEATTTASSTVWIEFDSLTGSASTTFYIYYDNPTATSVFNGSSTFLFFDHFDGSSINTDKWGFYEGANADYSVSDSKVNVDITTGSGANIYFQLESTSSFQGPFAIGTREYWTGGNDGNMNYCQIDQTSGNFPKEHSLAGYTYSEYQTWSRIYKTGAVELAYTGSHMPNTATKEFRRYGNSLVMGYYPNGFSSLLSATDGDYAGPYYVGKMFRSSLNAAFFGWLDWFFVRNFVDPEPTFGTWGEEELWHPPGPPGISPSGGGFMMF